MAIVPVFTLLLFFTYAFITPTHAEDCRVEMTNVDMGHLEVTAQQILGYGHHATCTWVLSSQPGKKLNAALENVSLPSDADKLTVLVDRVRHDVPAKCRNCLENLVGSVLTVNLSLTEVPNMPDPDGNLFTVQYRSFDPRRCEHPKRPEPHGQTVGKGRKVGERIWYRCRKPYRLVGSSENVCQAGKGPVAPTWKEATPSCVFQECGDGPVKLASDTGFVEYSMMDSSSPDAPTSCTWQVTTAPDKRIRVQVERLKLATRGAPEAALYVFDGERIPENELLKMTGNRALPVNASTTGNVLTIVFHSGNLSGLDAATSDFGFRLSYGAFASLAPRCHKLGDFRRGTVVNGHSTDAGSVVSFACDNDTVLVGKDSTVCLPTGKWSSEMPTCLPVEVDIVPGPDSSTQMSSKSWFASWPEVSETAKDPTRLNVTGFSRDGDGTLGSPRIQKEQMPHHLENDNFKPGYSEDVAVPEDVDIVQTTDKPNDSTDSAELPWLIIIIGVAAPLALVILGILAFLIYRKKYPVRMSLGRKFETFENPVYELKKKEVPDQLLQDPNELLRLTTN